MMESGRLRGLHSASAAVCVVSHRHDAAPRADIGLGPQDTPGPNPPPIGLWSNTAFGYSVMKKTLCEMRTSSASDPTSIFSITRAR